MGGTTSREKNHNVKQDVKTDENQKLLEDIMTVLEISEREKIIPEIRKLKKNNKFDIAIAANKRLNDNDYMVTKLNVAMSKKRHDVLKGHNKLHNEIVEFQKKEEAKVLPLDLPFAKHLSDLSVVKNKHLKTLQDVSFL